LVALITLDGILLTAANSSSERSLQATLVIAAVSIIPLFIGFLFLLQTRFRPQMLEDTFYVEYTRRIGDTAKQGVIATMTKQQISAQELLAAAKGEVSELSKTIASLDHSKPNVLTLRLGEQGYEPDPLQKYLSAFMGFPSFRGMAVIGENEVLHAYLPREA